jgi:hypothetical protein
LGGAESSDSVIRLQPRERTWASLSIIQPKKRANTTTSYFYCDPSFLLLKRRHDDESWICEAAVACGVQRSSTCEVFLDPVFTYVCLPFSSLSVSKGPFAFRLACYSASKVEMSCDSNVQGFASAFTAALHKELLMVKNKRVHYIAEACALVVAHGEGCLYFFALNGSMHSALSLKLTIEESDGVKLLLGRSDDTHFIPPRSQKLLASVSRLGRTDTSSDLKFRYVSATTPTSNGSRENHPYGGGVRAAGMSSTVPITLAGDMLSNHLEGNEESEKGSHSVDVAGWIPQIGASRVNQY